MMNVFVLVHLYINDNCESHSNLVCVYKTLEEAREGLRKEIANYLLEFAFDDDECEEFVRERMRSEDCFIDDCEEGGYYTEINIVETPMKD